jgi:hypothetical protein
MTPATCPRLFEVEARHDGRLAGSERHSFERHLLSCAACAQEARALEALRTELRARSPHPSDELQLRRERTRLLAAFNRTLVQQPAARSRARLAFGLAASMLTLAVVLWFGASRLFGPAPPQVVIQAAAGAVWSQHSAEDSELVTLKSGTLNIVVRREPGERALRVLLPDGELQDIGTTFSVTVENRHTTRVQVDEGSVLLERRGRAPSIILAGDTWLALSPVAQKPSSAQPAPAASERPLAAPSPTPTAATAVAARREPAPRTAANSTDLAASDFRAAMLALNTGQAKTAAAAFQRFSQRYPSDPRAEDAAYLRVLALVRAGDVNAQRAAAQSYLDRYPRGFRRAEIERMLR